MNQWLHYVGKRVYTVDKFIEEALLLGVQRAISLTLLKRLQWGDIIFLATYSRKKEGGEEENCASIFGFFTVEGVSYKLPPKANRKLKELIKVLKSMKPEGDDVIRRACGKYRVDEINYIDPESTPLPELAKAIEKAITYVGYKGRHKLFITGPFYHYGPLTLCGYPFTRGLVPLKEPLKVEFDTPLLAEATRLASYQQREYDPLLFKRRREAVVDAPAAD